MFILSVAPLTKISLPNPQTLIYFSSRQLKIGSIVLISLKNRDIAGVVISNEKLIPSRKIHLKKTANFTLRKIKKILCAKPFLQKWQIEIAIEMAKYYYEPLGLFLQLFFPKIITKKMFFKNYLFKQNEFTHQKQKIIFQAYDFNKEVLLHQIQQNPGVTLFLTPDIIAAKNWSNYLKNFSNTVLIYSKLSPQKKLQSWQTSQKLTKGVIVGTKTALWYLNSKVNLIILYNANSDYFKSWDQHPKYDARTALKIFNQKLGIKVLLVDQVLGSHFISLKNHQKKEFIAPYQFIKLKDNDSLINEEKIFSEALQENLNKIINTKKRALLYLNKKGYAKVVLCKNCGFVPKCNRCFLSLHLQDNHLICHICQKIDNAFNFCPKCKGHNFGYFQLGGEFIYKKIKENFPQLKIFKFDLNNALTNKKQLEIIKEFYASSPAVLIGTSLLFKITPDFYPPVDLAVVLNIDYDLFFPDYNAKEKTYLNLLKLNSLSQKLIIQSFQDFLEQFDFNEELTLRKMMKYPPFYKIVKLTLVAKKMNLLPRAKMLFDVLSEAVKLCIKKFNLTENDIILQGPLKKISKKNLSYNIIMKFSLNSFKYKNKLLQLIPVKADIDVEPKTIL